MENLSLTEYSTTKEALQYYSRGAVLAVIGVLTSAITYPLSVRIAKRLFGLRDFLNIHLVHLTRDRPLFRLSLTQTHSFLEFPKAVSITTSWRDAIRTTEQSSFDND
jgi:hypothetical protein